MRHHWMPSTTLVLVLPALAALQPTPEGRTARDENVPKLELAADPAIEKGRVAAVQGTLGAEPIRYAVGGLSILQPVVVMLLARDTADDLTLSLLKGDWTTARRTGSTKGSGIASFEFRTEGSFNILLRGPSTPVPFALVVWAGDELHPPMSDAVVTYDEFRKGKPGGTPAAATQPQDRPPSAGRPDAGAGGARGVPVVVWIVAAAVLGAAGAVFFLRARGGRRQV